MLGRIITMNFDVTKTATTLEDGITRLNKIVKLLRSPSGCPWDKVQTLESLKPCLVEEAYELLDKMNSDDCEGHEEELGDVLLQIVFQADIREEQGGFKLLDVINKVSDKLVRRHPHVFSNVLVNGVKDVLQNWENIKKGEGKSDKPRSPLAGVPNNLPSLLKAQRVQSKAAKSGFEPFKKENARGRVNSELILLDAITKEGSSDEIKRKFGDVVFALVSYARELGIDAETALKLTTDAFIEEFEKR